MGLRLKNLLPLLFLLQYLSYINCAFFDGCDNTINLNPGVSYVQSPYYPQNYPSSTSCRYKIVAPLDYYIEMQCDVNIYKSGSTCTTDNLYIDVDGDIQLRGSENVCGSGTLSRNSMFETLVMAYISTGNNSGRFNCKLNVKPQACSCGWGTTTRITNGQVAQDNEYPSMVTLKDIATQQPFFCGGSIISRRHILTAAHCAVQASSPANTVAMAGANNIANPTASKFYAEYRIQQFIIHEYYQSEPDTVNDIAILVTAKTILWSRGVGPICLPPKGATNDFSYNTADVIGHGTTSFSGPTSSYLLKVTLMISTNTDCQTQYNGIANINAGQICTYDYSGSGKDSCQFDSGGPVIYRQSRQYHVGLVSFGKDCGAGGYPMGVNTRTTYYLNWILQKIGNSNCATTTIS